MKVKMKTTLLNRRDLIRGVGGAVAAMSFPHILHAASGASTPVAATTNGRVRGYTDDGINVFKGVRYGASTESRRFMAPLPPQPWQGIADASAYGPSSPQLATQDSISEDCLFLNIWTPGVYDGKKRPVMLYIHGGAYSNGSGSSPLYDGAALAKRGDVVVVSVNHRLNAFGYLYLRRFGGDRFPDSGNCGQLDLVLALQWVKANIAAFGGDAGNVMVFGQSGGGAKIATMMAMPAATGLFHRAASMSGQQVTASGPANATARTRAFLEAVGIADNDITKLVTMDVDDLLKGLEANDPVLPYGRIYFGPVLDMRSLLRHPFYPDAAPQSLHIPMIIGNTQDETRAFLRDARYYELDWDDLPELLIPNMRVDIRPEFVIEEYRKLYPGISPSDLFFKATTAARSWRAAIIEAEERAKQERDNTWVYQLNFASPVEPRLGAPHTFDIPLVFGTLGAEGSLSGTGDDARRISRQMSDAFIALARTGSPNTDGLPDWRPFSLEKRETMVFDVETRMENDPRGAEREIFARVPYVQPGT